MKILQKDGTFGSVSVGRHTHLSTTPAMNEGNIEKVLTSPYTDEKTKQLIAVYLITRNNVNPPSANVTSVNSGSATGTTDSIPTVSPTKTGMDNIVDKVTEVAPKVVTPVVQSTENVVKHVSNTVGDTATNISTTFFNRATYIIIGCILVLIIFGIIILIIIKKRKKTKINNTVNTVKSLVASTPVIKNNE